MKIHICSERLIAVTAEPGEAQDYESARELVTNALGEYTRGWSSIELELFEWDGRVLILASPVEVYLPEFLVKLL